MRRLITSAAACVVLLGGAGTAFGAMTFYAPWENTTDTPRSGLNQLIPTEAATGVRSGGAVGNNPTPVVGGGAAGTGGRLVAPGGGSFFFFDVAGVGAGSLAEVVNNQAGTMQMFVKVDGSRVCDPDPNPTGCDSRQGVIAMFDTELSGGNIFSQDMFGLFVANRPGVAGLPNGPAIAVGWDNDEPVLSADISSWTLNEWHPVALTWDQVADEYSLYVDNALVGTRPYSAVAAGFVGPPAGMGEGLRIGAAGNGTGDPFFGEIDELKLFDMVVPEPGSLALLGIAGAMLIRRRAGA